MRSINFVHSCLRPLAGLLAGLTLLAGCSQDPTSSTGTAESAADKPGRIKIAGILSAEDQFYQMIQLGMQSAAQELDVELLMGNSTGMVDKEIALLEAYAAQGVKGIAVAPASVTASIPGLKQANASGIKIVTYDNIIKADFPNSNIQSDQVSLGSSTGRFVKAFVEQKLGGKAKIAMIEALAISPEVSAQRVQGFKDGIAGSAGIEVIAEQDAWMAPMAADVAESLMGANPELNVIWAANEGGTVGAVTAVRNLNKAGKVFVFGTDMSEQIATFVTAEDQILQAVTGQKAFEIGSNALKATVAAVRGEAVESKIQLPGILFTRDSPAQIVEFQELMRRAHQGQPAAGAPSDSTTAGH